MKLWYRSWLVPFSAWLVCCLISSPTLAEPFEVLKDEQGVTVSLNGKLLTRYLQQSGNKPVLWPIVGPHGDEVTRTYPLGEAKPGERDDHIHHRSFWFTHGDVNGVSFWHEAEGKTGNILHREYLKVQGGKTAVITTRNDWVGPDSVLHCRDTRRVTCRVDGDARVIDFDIEITAGDMACRFGDTKEGSFGLRLASSMKVDSEPGGKIVNAEGKRDKEAWGQPAPWVDYYGPLGEHTVGVAILNHPSSFGYPTHWHVRTYGLFAANPFGLKDFYGKSTLYDGSHTLQPGKSMSFHYRVVVHDGDHEKAKIADKFTKYAAMKVD